MLESIWYQKKSQYLVIRLLLLPLSWLYCGCAVLRRQAYKHHLIHSTSLPVPVIVAGNISVGGTGKTPLVIALVELLRKNQFNPGIISRGYGGQSEYWPQAVLPNSDPALVGDEPVLIAQRTQCPVYVAPQRIEAAKALLENHDCDVILCDDGLQHYALARDIEICVIDGQRRHGNGSCLPAGPLREPRSRLKEMDMIVCNGEGRKGEYSMTLEADKLQNLKDRTVTKPATHFTDEIHAVAGIGNPSRFFTTLQNMGLTMIEHIYTDHFKYSHQDIEYNDNKMIIMTEKDAVKCHSFANEKHWVLPVSATLTDVFQHRFITLLKEKLHG